MKRIWLTCLTLAMMLGATKAQDNVYPAPAAKAPILIKGGTVHVGNGTVLENADVLVEKGKIVQVGANIQAPSGATVVAAAGKKVYPGLILPASTLGLQEISGVRGSNDFSEIGEINPSVRSIVAYNAESKIINTLRTNGILLAHVAPQGSFVGGQSSVVQLDAWTWEDAAYSMDMGMHIYMPSLLSRPTGRFAALFASMMPAPTDPTKQALDKLEALKQFFRDAKTYFAQTGKKETNLKLEAARPLFEKKQKLYLHANQVKQMLLAVDFAKEFGFDVVIIGGSESWQIAHLLKENNIGVILSQMHNLPTLDDDHIDQPYKTPAMLQKAGVLFCINDDDPQNRGRNMPFNAGTAAAYGLTKEEALTAITLSAAKLLGIDQKTGSIEVGKDANIVISQGDILDMRSSVITDAFIQGRKIEINDKHIQLFERYKHRFQVK
ncbi:MAG: amidohydrolase family protein [Hydrotalea sp.]|nr:amidohydrolase family protein [Hydrotalea sp.]